MKRNGFTLPEMLVVVALVAIIAALLFPVFAGARRQAKARNCVSNLSQIYHAMSMYGEDNDGWVPPVAPAKAKSGMNGYWYEGGGRRWAEYVTSYSKEPSLVFCPVGRADEMGVREDFAEQRRRYTDYAYGPLITPRFFGSLDGVFRLNLRNLSGLEMLTPAETPWIEDVLFHTKDKELPTASTHGYRAAQVYLDGHADEAGL